MPPVHFEAKSSLNSTGYDCQKMILPVIPNRHVIIESELFGSTTSEVESIVLGWTTHLDVYFHIDMGKLPLSMYITDDFFLNVSLHLKFSTSNYYIEWSFF